ncbi:MAG: polysaccharide deacetylase family protein [Hyphomicrobiaceae bacterium]|nr:polysaccharide deacetylase family protein [Hyphomicrobiaceae bacterium]
MYYSGADGLAAPFTRGAGVIFMLHRVSSEPPAEFEPNRILKVTPEFIEQVIVHVIEAGFDILRLDEVPARLSQPTSRPFACFTFDDGYRDNLEVAYPVFRRLGVPFTVYIPTDYPDGRGDLWWLMLERVIAASDHRVSVEIAGTSHSHASHTPAEKDAAFEEIYWHLRRLPEPDARAVVARLAETHGFTAGALCSELMMDWDAIRELARDPLVTIAAHTRSHLALAKLDEEDVRREMSESIARIEAELGRPCRHFSYPYGCVASAGTREFAIARELGVATAVTTRKGLLYPAHADQLTALPRLSLNGDFQDLRYLKVMLSGMPFALWNAVTRESADIAEA